MIIPIKKIILENDILTSLSKNKTIYLIKGNPKDRATTNNFGEWHRNPL